MSAEHPPASSAPRSAEPTEIADQIYLALTFFASVITSGEDWTQTCAETMMRARNEVHRLVALTADRARLAQRVEALEEELADARAMLAHPRSGSTH